MPTAVRSHAKINLGLGIGAPRADGFHALCTVYQTLEVYDVVTVTAQSAVATTLRLTSNDARVPTDGRNTAWKMVALALEALGVTAKVEIHIEKRLPVQGGLGAGSANAVAALVGLEQELWFSASKPLCARSLRRTLSEASEENTSTPNWLSDSLPGNRPFDCGAIHGAGASCNLDLDSDWPSRRLSIAAKVGSDVPLFLIGGAVLGLDRGQEVHPLPDFEPVWCVVALPEIGVSTPQAFRDWDALCAEEGLTSEASTYKLEQLSRAYASAFAGGIPQGRQGAGSSGVLFDEENLAGPQESALVRTGITSWIANDFERVVFRQHPSLAEIKRILAASGTPEAALHASLSGSGSALFGLYRTQGDAEAACERLRVAGVKSLLTRTLPRQKYWREMLLP
jgi:4-diphosphocytidyl-2-C-methyl-D-erythritol kinase